MTCRSSLADEWFADFLARAEERPLRVKIAAEASTRWPDWQLARERRYDAETDQYREILRHLRPGGRGLRGDSALRLRHAAARLVARVDLRSVS